jgi:hypothetical protein
MKLYGRMQVKFLIFIISALDGDEWSTSHISQFIPRERAPNAHWAVCWVGLRAGLNEELQE